MNEAELRQKLLSPEDRFVERKPDGVSTEEVRNTLVAFANTVPLEQEAFLFIGIANNGGITGIKDSDKWQKEIRRIAEEKCYPPIRQNCTAVQVNGFTIVAVVIPYSTTKPHFSGHAYIRIGSETKKASTEMYEELIASRNDKARKLLSEKGKLVTVRLSRNVPEHVDPIIRHVMRYRNRECRIVDCNAHFVRVIDIGTDEFFSYSLQTLTITYDDERHRLQLDIITKE